MAKIIILHDYRGYFWRTTRLRDSSFDTERIVRALNDRGFEDITVKSFFELDLRDSYEGVYVLYTSSEDPGLYYKSFIEDVLLGLSLKGAVLIPSYNLLRAHHNKVFMEILRCVFLKEEYEKLPSRWYCCLQEFKQRNAPWNKLVFKRADGSGSRTVRLIEEKNGKKVIPKSIIRTWDSWLFVRDLIKGVWRSRYPDYVKNSQHRRKFITQEFLPGLAGDFKVLVFGTRCFVLERKVRDNDFRASGSGKFSFPESPDKELLDYAYGIKEQLGSPFLSLDIALCSRGFVLIEFQGVNFGPYTVEKSKFHFVKEDSIWVRVDGEVFVEDVLAESVADLLGRESVLR